MPREQDLKSAVDYITDKNNLDKFTRNALQTPECRRAKTETDRMNAVIVGLYVQVKNMLLEVNASLEDIIKNETLLNKFEQSKRLKSVIIYHNTVKNNTQRSADATSSQPITLESICINLFNARDILWKKAEGQEGECLLNFLSLVRDEFRRNGHSLSELFRPENSPLFLTYFTSGRLQAAMKEYISMIKSQSESTQPARPQPTDESDELFSRAELERRPERNAVEAEPTFFENLPPLPDIPDGTGFDYDDETEHPDLPGTGRPKF